MPSSPFYSKAHNDLYTSVVEVYKSLHNSLGVWMRDKLRDCDVGITNPSHYTPNFRRNTALVSSVSIYIRCIGCDMQLVALLLELLALFRHPFCQRFVTRDAFCLSIFTDILRDFH